ncbi:MAG: FxDxF family PEP-CTERM protein [Proteobacteria bacterium]|nr:FxDxF family PEP-CTERM protein [Pseudomonadota bacterium]
MKTFLAAAALSIGAIGAAQATIIPVVLSIPSGLGDGSPMTGSFSDIISGAGSFTDDIVFNGPPPTSTDTFTATAGSGITFTGVTLSYFSGGGSVPLSGSMTSTSINESTGTIISALYDLKISGTAAAGASYSGTISALPGVAAVPEPESWALMLLGLGATGAFVRGRKQRRD